MLYVKCIQVNDKIYPILFGSEIIPNGFLNAVMYAHNASFNLFYLPSLSWMN